MTDYISREAFLERVDGIWDCADMVFEPNDKCCRSDDCASCKWRETKNAIRKIAANIPAADVRETKRGEWKRHHKKIDGVYSEWCVCSVCGQMATAGACYYDNETPFCPWCGAKMDGGE